MDWPSRARKVLPGGVNSPVRAFQSVGLEPLFVERGDGARVWDVHGRRYLDFIMSWGALIHGHAHPRVVAAGRRALERGSSFGLTTPGEVRLAELLCAAFPFVEKVRLVNSGTEATMSALRLARAVTGRDRVVKFEGCYHGHADAFLVQAGSGALTLGHPSSPGIPASVTQHTYVLPYQDLAAVEQLFAEQGRHIAAVIVEPVAGNMGVIVPDTTFLQGLRDLTERHGALLIFDEVITGFRTAWGGWSTRTGIQPDLITLGKVIGGGFPVGAYGGPADIMGNVAPEGPVYQAGTLAGNPVAVAAGLAALELIREQNDFYADLERRTRRLKDALQEAFRRHGVAAQVHAVTGMLSVFFADHPVRNLADVKRSDTGFFTKFYRALLKRGVLLPPSPFEGWFLSAAHDDAVLDEFLGHLEEALAEVTGT